MLRPEEISDLRKCDIAGAFFPLTLSVSSHCNEQVWIFAEHKAISVASVYAGPESGTESRK